jgi:alcohol dehydrogenase (cytochrome c)
MGFADLSRPTRRQPENWRGSYDHSQAGDTGPAADTWKGSALALGGGATWLTGSADAEANVVYWAVGNPHPDTDGDERIGSNLYTNSDLAIDAKTGKMLWYYQFTPHDLHDWDANEPIVLVDAKWKGQDRKLLLHANRNGFLYVLDRTTGKPLLATKMVDKLNWASGIDERPGRRNCFRPTTTKTQGVGDLSRGARRHQLVFDGLQSGHASLLRDDGGGLHHSTARRKTAAIAGTTILPIPRKKILRAFDIETGKVAWQIDLPGPVQSNYSGV